MQIEVTQADYDAALNYLREWPRYQFTNGSLTAAFAAHRIAAEQQGYERAIAEVVAWLRRRRTWDENPNAARFKIADAIEAGEHRGGEAT